MWNRCCVKKIKVEKKNNIWAEMKGKHEKQFVWRAIVYIWTYIAFSRLSKHWIAHIQIISREKNKQTEKNRTIREISYPRKHTNVYIIFYSFSIAMVHP